MNKMSQFSYIVVMVLFLCVTSLYAAKVVDVGTICKKVKNPSFCVTLLNKMPGPNRDLLSLAQYTIVVARVNVTNTINLINTLIANSGSNADARNHYKTCLGHFKEDGGSVIAMVDEIQQYLKVGDYVSARLSASAIGVYVDACISGESPSDPPYHDTSLLPKYADIVDQVAEVIFNILNFLK
jgi:pectinesterase inhibitor-like protein